MTPQTDHPCPTTDRRFTHGADDAEHQFAHRAAILRSGVAAGGEIALDDRIGRRPAGARRIDHGVEDLDCRLNPCGWCHNVIPSSDNWAIRG